MSKLQQANFLLPEEVLGDLRRLVPRGEQSQVVTESLRRELKRRKLKSALQKSFGAWARRRDMAAVTLRGLGRRVRGPGW